MLHRRLTCSGRMLLSDSELIEECGHVGMAATPVPLLCTHAGRGGGGGGGGVHPEQVTCSMVAGMPQRRLLFCPSSAL